MHASRVWDRASWLMGMFMQAGSFIGKNGSDVEQLRAELGSEVDIKIANDVSLLVPMLGGKLPEGVAASDEGVKIEGKPALVLSALSTIALKLLAYQVDNPCFPASRPAMIEGERGTLELFCAVQEKYPGGRSNASASKGTTPRGEDLGSSASSAASHRCWALSMLS